MALRRVSKELSHFSPELQTVRHVVEDSPEKLFAKCEIVVDSVRKMRTSCSVHVISRKKLLDAATQHGDLSCALDIWYRLTKRADWRSLEDVRRTFPSADGVGDFTVFNIKGNSYRLIAEINYRTGRLYIRHVLTHAEYDKGGWRQ